MLGLFKKEKPLDESVFSNNGKIIPMRELVQIVMDSRCSILDLKFGVRNFNMSIKESTEDTQDLIKGENDIILDITFDIRHQRNEAFIDVIGHYIVTVKYDDHRLLVFRFESYANGHSVVDRSDILMEYSLIYGKGYLMSLDLHRLNTPEFDYDKSVKNIIKENFPTNLTQLKAVERGKNYDGYKSSFSLNKKKGGTGEKQNE